MVDELGVARCELLRVLRQRRGSRRLMDPSIRLQLYVIDLMLAVAGARRREEREVPVSAWYPVDERHVGNEGL